MGIGYPRIFSPPTIPFLCSLLQFLPCLILSNLPLSHLFPFKKQKTIIDTFQRNDFQAKCFRTKFVDWTETDWEGEAKDEEFTNCVTGFGFWTGGDKVGCDCGVCHG